ncbi:MAG TPA: hypothetical protein VLA93_05945 [Pyrinomonadaceae bacterium]|nr:hypothetical protein [Pyrinomonadaceae bacterium]
MAHPLSRKWHSTRIFTDSSGFPVAVDDGFVVLELDDAGNPDLSKCKKKKNETDPGDPIEVEVKSDSDVHKVTVTLTKSPFTTYVGFFSELWSSSSKKLLVGKFTNPVNEREELKDNALDDGQIDGTWTGTHP